MFAPASAGRGGGLTGLSILFYAAILALSFASFATTHLGAQWLMGGDQDLFRSIAAISLALGVQLAVAFASLVIASSINSALAARIKWLKAILISLLAVIAGSFGIAFSGGTSYVNYHQVVNNNHLQGLADLGIEQMEREYQAGREHVRRNVLTYIDLSVKQASTEWAFWDSERRLQDSTYSPNQKGRGSRFTFAHTQAETLADYLELHTGKRPQGGDPLLSRQAGSLTSERTTAQRIEAEFENVPESLDIYNEVKGLTEPRERFLQGYFRYKTGMQSLIKAFSNIPSPDTLRLPEQQREFIGKHVGDRVTLTIDNQAVSNVPIPPPRPTLPELLETAPEVAPSVQMLRKTVASFYQELGKNNDEAYRLAQREVLVIGENPVLVAASQLRELGVVELVTLTPAVIVDFSILLIGFLYGFMSVLRTEEDPLSLMDKMSQTLEAMIDGLGKRVRTQPTGGGTQG